MGTLMARMVLLLLALLVMRANAGEVVNDAQVAACIADNRGDAALCIAVLEAPCAHHKATGLMRACMFRLRERWERYLSAEEVPLPTSEQVAQWCPRLGGDAETESIARNRCRIAGLATNWARARGLAQ